MAPSLEETPRMSTPQTASNKDAAMEAHTSDHLMKSSLQPKTRIHPHTNYQHVWYITGPSGCGKSTVAQYIATALQLPFLEGDNFHPAENVEKMHAGHPLTDTDRWDWLIALREAATQVLHGEKPTIPNPSAGSSTPPAESSGKSEKTTEQSQDPAARVHSNAHPPIEHTTHPPPPPIDEITGKRADGRPHGVVLTCSALKQKYRDVLRVSGYMDPTIRVHFVYLHATEEMLVERVGKRKDHYMGAEMVKSQFKTLEVPNEDVEWDVVRVGVEKGKVEVEEDALRAVEEAVRGIVGDAE